MKKLLLVFAIGISPLILICQQNTSIKKVPLPLAVYGDNIQIPLSPKERAFIMEVYGQYAEKYVFSRPQMLKDLKQLLRNRIVIKKNSPFAAQKKAIQLSSIPLFNAYVPDLKRDSNFNPNSFNPLKYNFGFSNMEAKLYSVDGTDYTILIKSQYQN